MKRKVTLEEIARFFSIADKQFEESGIALSSVMFVRENGKLAKIKISCSRIKPGTE